MTPERKTMSRSHDAESESSPTDILQAIEKQQSMRRGSEARKSPRQFVCVPATLQIQESPTAPARPANVATNNISEGGFGFIYDGPLRAGARIRACFDSLPGKPCIMGVVRSSVRICGTQHRVGVEFVK